MYYSSRKAGGSPSRKQTSFSRITTTRFEDGGDGGGGSPSGNETDGGSAELLDISTSREDLSRAVSRCSCHSGESSAMKIEAKSESAGGAHARGNLQSSGTRAWSSSDGALANGNMQASGSRAWASSEGALDTGNLQASGSRAWSSSNLRLELDNNAGSDDEMLKEELLRIFDRERHGLESYFKQKTENILQQYRRKQCEWEESMRLEKIEHEKCLAQEKIDVQQNYIGEMTKLTKQFNQEREELEAHYKTQISELTLQFETRKKEMDETIIKERTELKLRLEMEYQSMLTTQRSADEQMYQRQKSELEEGYKRRVTELEQKLRESCSEGEYSGRKMQSELEGKFEKERGALALEWRKRVESFEVELGKEKERANKEERKAIESHGFHRNEVSKKEIEVEKLRQVVETLRADISKKDKTAKEFEAFEQNMFLRGRQALSGKLREDFEKMLAAHREDLERSSRKEREGLEAERDRRAVVERETVERQSRMERERMVVEMEKERDETRRAATEKEDGLREELRREGERMRAVVETEKEALRNELRNERMAISEKYSKEKDEMDKQTKQQSKRAFDSQEEEREKGLERQEYDVREVYRKKEHTKQWVEGQHRVTEKKSVKSEDNRGSDGKNRRSDGLSLDDGRRSDQNDQNEQFSNIQVERNVGHRTVEEKNETNLTINVTGSDKNVEHSLRKLKHENEGLRTKVTALQENIKLHECYKGEASGEIERLRKTNREMKTKLTEMKEKMKSCEEQLEDSEEKIKEYEKVCEDYEKYLQECREKILVIEKDRKASTTVRVGDDDGRRVSYPWDSRNDYEDNDGRKTSGRKFEKESEGEDERMEYLKTTYKQKEAEQESTLNILRIEKEKLEGVVRDLENKIRLLETKISETSLVSSKNDNNGEDKEKREHSSNYEKVRRQNRDLVNKVKDLQVQLQGMVDKLRKEKKKVKILQTEYRSFNSTHLSEIKELQEKLEHSGRVIARLQNASAESSTVGKLQEEISMIGKWMVEERMNDQRMIKTRSVEEMEALRSLDRDKNELERKLQDVRAALDGYSERLKSKVSFTNQAVTQYSSSSNGYLRDARLSKTLQALEQSQKTSLRQNERLLHEKKELQSLVGRLCKSQEDLRGSKMSIASCGSSSSSSSSSSLVLPTRSGARYSSKISSVFSGFD